MATLKKIGIMFWTKRLKQNSNECHNFLPVKCISLDIEHNLTLCIVHIIATRLFICIIYKNKNIAL